MRRSDNLLRTYITEVLTGFGNKSYGKDGVAGNLHPDGVSTGSSSVIQQRGNVLTDEDSEEQTEEQSIKQAACCLIMSHDGTILTVSRKDNPLAFGIPGGKVDPGEQPIDAAARELTEETGLFATKLHQIFSRRDAQGFVTTTFACEVEGQIDTDEEGIIKWVHPSVLASDATSPFAAYNRDMFDTLGISYG
jgi:8-oxo-dGTP pyrophosphatase MutT (NUDIX family)